MREGVTPSLTPHYTPPYGSCCRPQLIVIDLTESKLTSISISFGMEEGEDQERNEMSAGNTWMECSIYQNYTASEVMVQGLAGVVNQGDVEEMVRAQKEMLQRFLLMGTHPPSWLAPHSRAPRPPVMRDQAAQRVSRSRCPGNT